MALDRSTIWPYRDGEPGDFFYSRYDHPVGAEAERALGELEGGRPLEHGADVVLHSATKYLGGHHDALAGALVFRSEDDHRRIKEFRGRTGPIVAPDTAWLVLRGLKTLEVRVRRQSESALELARR